MRARWILVVGAVLVLGGLLAVTVAGFIVGGGAMLVVTAATADAATCQATPQVGDVPPVGKLDGEQAANAATIVAVGRAMGVPEQGWVIAVAVAMQESTLKNVDHGDDWWFGGPGRSPSRGLFQMMPSWGPLEVRMDPAGASRLFYEHLLAPTDYRGRPKPDWRTVPLAQAAQAVQGSAFPAEYTKHEPLARQVVTDLAGVTVPASACRQAPVVGDGAVRLPLPPGKVHAPVAEHHNGPNGTPGYPATDLPLAPGETQPVFTMTAGIATPMNEPGGCGYGVYVRGETGEWLYCHLSQQLVGDGQQVQAGAQIGVSGWSGGVSPPGPGGAHLHVQLKRGGRLTCLQPVLDALVAGQAPPGFEVLPQPAGNTCLAVWAARN